MRCHYEVLGVERTPAPDDDVIRRAYRRAALRCHPDKVASLGDAAAAAAAEEEFKAVQAAYECLSDPHERAFYDGHRESILRGVPPPGANATSGGGGGGGRRGRGGGGEGGEWVGEDPDNVNLWPYFSPGCFEGLGDGPREFYGVYGRVFDEIDACERRANPGGHVPAPRFGGAGQRWEPSVAAFYAHWGAYSSGKAFAWAEPYNLGAAADRRERRLMEADNAKARRRAKREWDEQVRGLVAFVRKRDRRAAAQAAEVRRAREAREEAAKAAKAERKAEARRAAAAYAATDEAKQEAEEAARAMLWTYGAFGGASPGVAAAEEGGDAADAGNGDDEDEDGVEVVEVFVCYACDKEFKSERAMQNHEKSRKHADEVRRLRTELMREERAAKKAQARAQKEQDDNEQEEETEYEDAETSPDEADGDREEVEEEEVEEKETPEMVREEAKEVEINEKKASSGEEEEEEAEEEEEDLEAMLAALNFRGASAGGGRRRRGVGLLGTEDEGDDYTASPSTQRARSKKSERRRLAREQQPRAPVAAAGAEDAEEAGEGEDEDEDEEGVVADEVVGGAVLGRAKARKAKKASRAAKGGGGRDDGNACAGCREAFPSRTKLMQHLKANPAHAALRR